MDQSLVGARFPAFPDPLDLEPLHEVKYSFLVQNPNEWHLLCWLSLGVVGLVVGEDALRLLLTIQTEATELDHVPDPHMMIEFRYSSNQFQIANREQCERLWAEFDLDSDATKWFLHDIDKMLYRKGLEVRNYLWTVDERLIVILQTTKVKTPSGFIERLDGVWRD